VKAGAVITGAIYPIVQAIVVVFYLVKGKLDLGIGLDLGIALSAVIDVCLISIPCLILCSKIKRMPPAQREGSQITNTQIAGRKCVVCEEKIFIADDGKLCKGCGQPLHRDCEADHKCTV
jgi:hypothetical protein